MNPEEEDAARASDDLIASIDDLVFVLDLEGHVLRHHAPPGQPVLGALASLAGRPYHEVVHDETAVALGAAFERVRATGEAGSLDYLIVHDGRTTWWNARITGRWAGGRLVGFTAVCRNIDDRKAAEAELRRREEELRLVFELAPVGLAEVDLAANRWVRVNSRFCALTGYAAEELLALPLGALTPPEDRLATLAAAAVARGARLVPETGDRRILRKDGTIALVAARAAFVEQGPGRPAHLLTTFEDVTLERAAAAALAEAHARYRASEERYRSLVDHIEDVVFSTDPQGVVTFVNPAVARFGHRPEDLVGRPLSDHAVPEDQVALASLLAAGPAAEGGRTLEHRLVDAAGGVRHVRTSSRPFCVEGGVVGRTGVIVDHTERRRTEEQLRAAQKMEAVGRLAGGIAHDFNNLLSVILSYADEAMGALPKADPLHDDLGEIIEATRRGAELTRQLLAFSRRQVLHARPVALNVLVERIARMLRRMIGEPIALELDLADGLGWTRVDPGQVEQVLVNLVVNARDAMPHGGRVVVATRNVELTVERAAGLGVAPGAYVELSVTDCGIGMDEVTAGRIFEPFFTTKPAGQGTGLGLSMVYGIVAQSGGAVAVETAPGAGATFRVWLPRVEAGEDAVSRPVTRPAPAVRGRETILVVEDEPAIRSLLGRVLARAGYEVLLAVDAAQALALAERHGAAIELVLTDVVLPGMGGRALAQELRPRLPRARIVFMSGYGDGAVERDGVDPLGCIAKPFDARTLLEHVRATLTADPA